MWRGLGGMRPNEPTHETLSGAPIVDGGTTIEELLGAALQRERIESLLPRWMRAQRWFAGKAREIRAVCLVAAVPVTEHSVYCVVRVQYAQGADEDYAVPMCWLPADSDSPALRPATVLARTVNRDGFLCDATADARFHGELFHAIVDATRFEGSGVAVVGSPERGVHHDSIGQSHVISQEQSNTSIRFGERNVLKLFRRLEPGLHPDVETAAFLARPPRFEHVAALNGTLELHADEGPTTLAMLSEWVPHQGDAWTRVVAMAETEIGEAAGQPRTPSAPDPASQFAATRVLADSLGVQSAQLHVRLASDAEDVHFAPEPWTQADCEALLDRLQRQAYATRALLRTEKQRIPLRWRGHLEPLLEEPRRALDRFESLRGLEVGTARIRCHGDFHLGQVLCRESPGAKHDFVFLDFEGEPAIPLQVRRGKSCALRDVASMVRSLEYAAWMAHRRIWGDGSEVVDAIRDVVTAEWARTMGVAFVAGYRRGLRMDGVANDPATIPIVPQDSGEFKLLLDAYRFEKTMYELAYELNNRPDWIEIPLRGLCDLLGEA